MAGYAQVVQAVYNIAAKTGLFSTVLAHEPKGAPDDSGMTLAIWGSELRPIQSSGLGVVSARLEIQLRIHRNMLTEPQDGIDFELFAATDAVMGALVGDFTLAAADPSITGQVRQIDIFGSDGDSLRSIAGYAQINNTHFRVSDIFVPLLLNDLWTVG